MVKCPSPSDLLGFVLFEFLLAHVCTKYYLTTSGFHCFVRASWGVELHGRCLKVNGTKFVIVVFSVLILKPVFSPLMFFSFLLLFS